MGRLQTRLGTVVWGVLCLASFANAADAPGAAKGLLNDEVSQLTFSRLTKGSLKKDLGDARDPSLAASIAKITGKEKPKLEDLEEVMARLEKDGNAEALAELASLLKYQRKLEESPESSPAQVAQSILSESLEHFAKADSKVELPGALGERLLKEFQTQDEAAEREKRQEITGAALKEFFSDKANLAKFSPQEVLKIAAAGEYTAALRFGDEALQRRAENSERSLRQGNPAMQMPPVKPAPRVQRDPEPMGEGGGALPQPGGAQGGGVCRGGGGAPGGGHARGGGGRGIGGGGLARGQSASLADISASDLEKTAKADRKAVTMEIGFKIQDPLNPQNAYFSSRSLCQANFVKPSENATKECDASGMERHLLMTAAHCFGNLTNASTIRLEGIGYVDVKNTDVFSSKKDDFSVMMVDLPCGTNVPEDVLAPPGSLAGQGGQTIVMDVHRTGKQAVAGKTTGLDSEGRMGVNVLGQGRIFEGDSGGRNALVMPDGSTRFIGVTSAKYVDSVYRDGYGTIAVVPQWVYQKISSREFYQPIQQQVFARHGAPELGTLANASHSGLDGGR